jgi:hypothetical protein
MANAHLRLAIALAGTMIPTAALGSLGPGEAAAHSAPRADFKVAVWYRKSDSLGTFKYEIYDLRKGEYSPKVDEWANELKTKYPAYYVVVRDVDLKREKGSTDLLKVGSVIDRELAVAAALAGIAIGPGGRPSASDYSGMFGGSRRGGSTDATRPMPVRVDRSFLNTPGPSFPVPVPFPRLPR